MQIRIARYGCTPLQMRERAGRTRRLRRTWSACYLGRFAEVREGWGRRSPVADAHQDRLPARVKRFRRARATVSVHDEVIKIDISKAEAMDPVPGTIVGA